MSTYNGSNVDDSLVGTGYGEWFYGRLGDDVIRGGGGDDYIDGGEGFDYAEFSDFDNVIKLTKKGYQKTNDGRVKLVSIEGVYGGGGDDYIVGHKKINNHLIGGDGADWLQAGKNSVDILSGGEGTDTFELKKGKGYAIIEDYSSGDWIYIKKAKPKHLSYEWVGDTTQIFIKDDLVAEFYGVGEADLYQESKKYFYLEVMTLGES